MNRDIEIAYTHIARLILDYNSRCSQAIKTTIVGRGMSKRGDRLNTRPHEKK